MNPASKQTEKTILWSRLLYLFHRYKDYIGPFYKAGYKNYKLQNEIKRNNKTLTSIDLITWNEDKRLGCGIEVTTNFHEDKNDQLNKQKSITINELAEQIPLEVVSPLDIILVANSKHETDYCHIVISDSYLIHNENQLKDTVLKNELKTILPEIDHFPPQPKFTMDTEPSEYELRNGLVSPIMSMIYNGTNKTPEDLIKEALDFTYENTSHDARDVLIKRSKKAINELRKKFLSSVIQFDGKEYTVNSKYIGNKRLLKGLNDGISLWIQQSKTRQSMLTEWME